MVTPTRRTRPRPLDDDGFTLVELVVAVVILAVGLLGLAGTTAFVVRQTSLAEVTTERAMALQAVVETVRAQPYGSVGSDSEVVGSFQASWSVVANTGDALTVEVVTVGPGLETVGGVPTLVDQVADTFYFQRVNYF